MVYVHGAYMFPIFHNKLSYPRARSAMPCIIEHSVQLYKIARYLECLASQDRPIRQRLTAGCQQTLLVSVGIINQIDIWARNLTLMSLCSQLREWRPLYDYWLPWRNSVHVTVQIRNSQLVYILHLATETGNFAWQMNKRSILRDLLWPIYNFKTSNEVWISDKPPRWPHRQNNWLEYSIRPGSCGSTGVRQAKGRWYFLI